jgi:integrase
VLVDNRPALLARTKTKSGVRVVDLDGWTVATLRAFRAAQLEERLAWGPAWQDRGLVFTREDGSWIHPDTFSEWFRKHSDRANLPRIRFHDVRHTYATLALQAGIPAKIVSERLGHKNIGITLDTYSHVTPGMQEEAAAKVAALILDGE